MAKDLEARPPIGLILGIVYSFRISTRAWADSKDTSPRSYEENRDNRTLGETLFTPQSREVP